MPSPAKAGSHTAGRRGDGHRPGSWTVMPRAGPHIAHGPEQGQEHKPQPPGTTTQEWGDRKADPHQVPLTSGWTDFSVEIAPQAELFLMSVGAAQRAGPSDMVG